MSAMVWAAIAVLLYNLAVMAGCAYLVAAHGWSAWWFVLAYLCLAGTGVGKKEAAE